MIYERAGCASPSNIAKPYSPGNLSGELPSLEAFQSRAFPDVDATAGRQAREGSMTARKSLRSSQSSSSDWSRLSVFLHWLIVALIIGQWLEGEYMISLWDGTLEGKPISTTTNILGTTHIVFGSVILAAAVVRLLDRFVNGRPPYKDRSDREPNWATSLAKITHVLLYAIIIVMPVLGLAAWFTGSDTIAGYHTLLWNPLLAVAGLHICGALAQHFYFRTKALARMVPMLKSQS